MLPKSSRPGWMVQFEQPLQEGLFGTPWSDRSEAQVRPRQSADGRQPLKAPGVFEGTPFGKPARYGWGRMV